MSFLYYCYQIQALSACHMTGQLTERGAVEAGNEILFGKLAEWEDGRLMSQNNHLARVWMPVSFLGQRGGGVEEVKIIILQISPGMASLKKGMGCVNLFRQRGRVPWGRSFYMIMITKEWKAKVKVKEIDPSWSQNWPFPATLLQWSRSVVSDSLWPYGL